MFIQLNFLLTNVFIAAFVNNVWTKQQTILIRTRGLYRLKIKFRIIVYRGHPYSTYAQKSPQLDPPHPLYKIVRIWIQFISGSSLRHSQFLDYFHFYLSLGLIFTKPISKKFILNSPSPLYAIVRIRLDPFPPPLCVRTMWITP